MIGSIIGSGLKAVGSIFGGIASRRAMKKVKQNIEQQQKENQAWYDRRYNEDATQRADAQALLNKTEESIRNRNQQAAASAVVTGGTEESVAAARAANNQALTDVTSNIAAQADARKDAIEQQYLQTKSDLNNQLNNLQINKAQNIAQAVGGVADAGASIASAFDKKQA